MAVAVGDRSTVSPVRRLGAALNTQRAWLRIGVVLSIVYLLAFLFQSLLTAMHAAGEFDGYASNGAFQLYNPLRRMAEGEMPGRDFPFFHGVGVPWLHLPIYLLLGGGIFGSEMSRYLVSPLLFLLTTGAFFAAFFKEWKRALIGTALFTVLATGFIDVVAPGNSLIGVRGTVPILVAAVLLLRPPRHSWRLGPLRFDARLLGAMVLLGLSVPFGTEQGVAAIGAYAIVRILVLWRHRTKPLLLLQLVVEGLIVGLVAFASLAVLTSGHPMEALRYALIEIPQDQGWYFGVPPNTYLTIDSFFVLMGSGETPLMLVVLVLAAVVLLIARRLGVMRAHEKRAYLYMGIYGVAACASFFGYFWPQSQMAPLARCAGLLLVAVVLQTLLSEKGRDLYQRQDAAALPKIAKDAIVVSLVVILFSFGTGLYGQYSQVRDIDVRASVGRALKAPSEDDYFASSQRWRDRIDAFKPYLDQGGEVWSTYSSLYEAEEGVFNPSTKGEDYIIHALGDERRQQYEQQFIDDKPEFAITLKPGYFAYEEWLWGGDSAFYAQLASHYDVVSENSSHYLWRLRGDGDQKTAGAAVQAVKGENGNFSIDAGDATQTALYQVTVKYDAGTVIPFAGKLDRYFVTTPGAALSMPVSLPPDKHEFTFLMPMVQGQTHVDIGTETGGIIPTARLTLNSVEYKRVNLTPTGNTPFRDNFCQYLSQDPLYANVCSVAEVTAETESEGGSHVTP